MVSNASVGTPDDFNPGTGRDQTPSAVRGNSISAGLDGDLAVRLIEVSRSLHRATVAIDGIEPGSLAQLCVGQSPELDADGNVLEGIARDTALGHVNVAIALVDGLNAAWSAQSAEMSVDLPPVEFGAPSSDPLAEAFPVATEMADSLVPVLGRIAAELNTSVIRGTFEAALMLASALQFVSDDQVAERISAAIEILDENIRQVRTLVFGFGSPGWTGDTGSKLP
jgi:hypothetical protein